MTQLSDLLNSIAEFFKENDISPMNCTVIFDMDIQADAVRLTDQADAQYDDIDLEFAIIYFDDPDYEEVDLTNVRSDANISAVKKREH